MNTEIKTIKDAFHALGDLVKSQGYLYVLLFIIEDDIFVPISQIEEANPRIRISIKEAAMLLGLLVKESSNILEEPTGIYSLLQLRKETYQLLEDLHFAMNDPFAQIMREAVSRMDKGEEPRFPTKSDMANATFQRETFFYSNEPAYDLEYLKFAPAKYKYDKDWLYEHNGFDIDEVIQIALNIKATFNERMQKIQSFSKEKLKEIIMKDRRLRKNPQAIEKALDFYALYKYESLLSTEMREEENKDYIDYVNCHDLCEILLDLFSLDVAFCKEQTRYESFLRNFSFEINSGVNTNYTEPGTNNIITWKPIIKIDKNRSILPIPYLLFQSIYESPYYWFLEDPKYFKKAGSHMGTSGEDMVYSLLHPIFGESRIFRNVIIKKGKDIVTDIDVLCLLGNKALCIQVKTKKLTESAQIGNDVSYKKDFKGAISDAYQQGVLCRDSILSHDNKLYLDNGKTLDIMSIDDVYILCITTGFYPAIPLQVRLLLKLKEDKPTPIVVNLFDLHIITHYLTDPYDFLYYIRQRIATNDYFEANNETILLSYHLTHKLWKNPKYNIEYLDQSIADEIDKDYCTFFNLDDNAINERNSLTCRWLNESFRNFLFEIRNNKDPHVTDIIFDLYDCSNESERILTMIEAARDRSVQNQSIVSMCIVFDNGKFGITYTASFSSSTSDLLDQMTTYANSHKYKSKGEKWIGFASCVYHTNKIDLLMYDTNPWAKDKELESEIKELDSMTNKLFAVVPTKKKIGRNEPCPCGSGLKYKNCHGKH